MAAYAAVTSLMGTIHLISQSNFHLKEVHKEHLKLLYQKLGSLKEHLDNSNDRPLKDMQKKIKDVAHKAEDEVESYIRREAHKTHLNILRRVFHLPTMAHKRLLKILQRAIEDIDSFKEQFINHKQAMNEWRKVTQSLDSSVILHDNEALARALVLSYNDLPSQLKVSLLYFGVFPKSSEISVKKLIKIWAAEELLVLKGHEELEKVAVNLIHELIEKSLVIVSKRSLNGKIKTCRVHDLVHDLCLKEAESENLLYAVNPEIGKGYRRFSPQGRRWVSVCSKGDYHPVPFDDLTHSRTRSLHFFVNGTEPVNELRLSDFKLLRVLDLESMVLNDIPTSILDLVCLRYVALKITTSKCLQISSLWNLQTFIVHGSSLIMSPTISLPLEIWGMSRLRHLDSSRMYLSSPMKVSANEGKCPVLENLQSVSGLIPSCCTKDIFQGIRKVKKVGIFGRQDEFRAEPKFLDNLIYLDELETLNITSSGSHSNESFFRVPCLSFFPPNLKKLTLCNTYLQMEDLRVIGQLLKLEVLKLKANAFVHEEWEVTEAEFPGLKFLLLENLHLEYWRATDDSFPCLERVIIRNCSSLQEIPKGFGESTTLQLIELHHCSPSLVTSAKQIQEEQADMDSNMLKVCIFDIKDSCSDVGGEQTAEQDI